MGNYIKQTIKVLFAIILTTGLITFLNYALKTKIDFINKIDLVNKVIMKPKINNIADLFPQLAFDSISFLCNFIRKDLSMLRNRQEKRLRKKSQSRKY
jgi:hypothetical protein